MINEVIKKIIKYPLTLMVGLFLIVMLFVYICKKDAVVSEVENRSLAMRPEISLDGLADGSFMSSFEDYTEDQLPLRDAFIRVKAFCEIILLKTENNGIAKGKDGFLFEKNYELSGQLHKNISAIGNFVKDINRDVYIAIAPTSTRVYEEKIPYGLPVLDEEKASIELNNALSKYENAQVINLYDAIVENPADDRDELYYRTDHHWTTKGAYKAYCEIAGRMNFVPVDFETLTKNQVDNFYGTFYSKYKGIGIKPDTITYVDVDIESYLADSDEHSSLMDLDKINAYDKYAMFMYGNPGKGLIKTSCHNGKKLIVLKDSYANSLLPFMACSYENIVVLDLRYFGGSVQETLQENMDADVLLMYNWSFMNEDNHFYKLIK